MTHLKPSLKEYAGRAIMIAGLAASLALGSVADTAVARNIDGGAPPAPLILKRTVSVSGDQVFLSDLFSNVPFTQDMVISEAPRPGESLTFSGRQLAHITRQAKLTWVPADPRNGVVVERDSLSIPIEDVEHAVAGAIAERHTGDDFDVRIFDRDAKLHVEPGSDDRVIVTDLRFDARQGRFNATVTAAGAQGHAITVKGEIQAMVDMPVLNRRLMPGDLITERDIQWRRVPARQATMTTVTRIDELIGYTPRRPIMPGQAIRMTDVVPDYVIQKGDLVTLLLQTGNMTLTARGHALQRGAKGDVIRIRNTQSKKTVEAKIVAADTAVVKANRLASLN